MPASIACRHRLSARFSDSLARCSGAILLLASQVVPVQALPLTLFRHQSQAERHCPGDRVVWLDPGKGVYYVEGQRRYAQGYSASFVCLKEARRSGYRRSLMGIR